ncbi:MAG: hypothetical protein HY897_18530 [Deltaproteobacteria bacterium]|nr:hypothetical protein [Deltaproteobacteria bacterium]
MRRVGEEVVALMATPLVAQCCSWLLFPYFTCSIVWAMRMPQSLEVVMSESETIVVGEAVITDPEAYKTCQWKDWGLVNVEKTILGTVRPGDKVRLTGWHWPCAEGTPDYSNIRGTKIWLLDGNGDGTFSARRRENVRDLGDEETVRRILGTKTAAKPLAYLAERKRRDEAEAQRVSEDDEITTIMGGIGIGVVLVVAVLLVALRIRARSVRPRGARRYPGP